MAYTSAEIRAQVGLWADQLELYMLAGEIDEGDYEPNVRYALDWAQKELQPMAQEAGGRDAQQGLSDKRASQSEPGSGGRARGGWLLAWLINQPRPARPQISSAPAAAL